MYFSKGFQIYIEFIFSYALHVHVYYSGGILVAADYSQLELRMIAHLSNDQKLIRILNEDGDVFKLITAQWKGITPEEVTPVQRQQAKQVLVVTRPSNYILCCI